MVCNRCQTAYDKKETICPNCGYKNQTGFDTVIFRKIIQNDGYLASLLIASTLLTTLFGILSLWQPSLAILSFFGVTSGLIGIILNKYQKDPYDLLFKIGYVILVFSFFLNIFSLVFHFISIFTDSF